MFFFFNDTATTEIYTLSLHDALPICGVGGVLLGLFVYTAFGGDGSPGVNWTQWALSVAIADRKSTRLNSSHANISYAVFCLKKKNLTFVLFSPLFILSRLLYPFPVRI